MIRFGAFVTSIVVMSTIIGFMPNGMGAMYYILLALLGILTVGQKSVRIDCKIFLLVFFCGVSILLSRYYVLFHSVQRFIAWVLLLLVVTPLISTERSEKFRTLLFVYMLRLCMFVTAVSFVCYFLHINFARVQTDGLDFSEVHFGGITTHSMLLAPLSAISCLYSIYILSLSAEDKKRIVLGLLMVFVSFSTCVIAASRGALLALLCASVFLICKIFSRKGKLSFLVGLFLISLFTSNLWGDFVYRLVKKQEYNVSEGGTFYSRATKWEARWNEFSANPIFGVGFAQIDPSMGDNYDSKTGTVEPGTSWGAVLSMTGLCGFFCLLFIFGNSFMRNYRYASKESFFLCSLTLFFMIHLLVEGYIYAAGSILCFMLWLFLTQVVNTKGYSQY